MIDTVRITFESDGHTESRYADSPCLTGVPRRETLDGITWESAVDDTSRLRYHREATWSGCWVYVWRLRRTSPLTGRWERARIESYEHENERLRRSLVALLEERQRHCACHAQQTAALEGLVSKWRRRAAEKTLEAQNAGRELRGLAAAIWESVS